MESSPSTENQPQTLSYKAFLFLLRLSEEGSELLIIPKDPILKLLLTIQQEIKLNELEITILAIYLERFGWLCREPLDKTLAFLSWTAKCMLNENRGEAESILQKKYSFFHEYTKWIAKYRKDLIIGYIEINFKYKKLSKADVTSEEVDCYDYNLAVTQLIESSTRPEKLES